MQKAVDRSKPSLSAASNLQATRILRCAYAVLTLLKSTLVNQMINQKVIKQKVS